MLSLLGSIFGSKEVVSKGMELIDDAWSTDEELIEAKTKAKVELLNAYSPFKLAQRYIAFLFAGVFVFILLNGVLGHIYGVVDIENVQAAKEFANSMWLGEIMLAIVGFYFGGGFIESRNRKGASDG